MMPIRQWNPELSERLEQIILKCTEFEPEDRYQSCEEVYRALESVYGVNAGGEGQAAMKQGVLGKLLSGGFIRREKEPVQPEPEPAVYAGMDTGQEVPCDSGDKEQDIYGGGGTGRAFQGGPGGGGRIII